MRAHLVVLRGQWGGDKCGRAQHGGLVEAELHDLLPISDDLPSISDDLPCISDDLPCISEGAHEDAPMVRGLVRLRVRVRLRLRVRVRVRARARVMVRVRVRVS